MMLEFDFEQKRFVHFDKLFDEGFEDPIEVACTHGILAVLQVLVTRENVNEPYSDRFWQEFLPLRSVCRLGHLECVRYLLSLGARIEATYLGENLLHEVVCTKCDLERSRELIDTLLEAGVELEGETIRDETPLAWAVGLENRNAVKWLIDRGARVENIKLGRHLKTIPSFVCVIVRGRASCRVAAVTVISMRRCCVMRRCVCDANVLSMIAKHIWSMRMDESWYGDEDSDNINKSETQ
jgi:hypothetical protein